MGILIDPSLEFVWRDPQTVQIGVDPPRAIVPIPSIAEERFLVALRAETSRSALPAVAEQSGCTVDSAAAVLTAAAPVLIDGNAPGADARVVEVHGSCATVALITDALRDEGVSVQRSGASPDTADTDPALVIAVARHVVDPALRSAWTVRDVPVLPVTISDGCCRVGPLVLPHTSPCLHCVELARTDDDPAWPAIAAQVWGRRPRRSPGYFMLQAAATACCLALEYLSTGSDARTDEQILLTMHDCVPSLRRISPHPRCACAGLPGIDSRPAPRLALRHDETTTP